jgi:hypothetical protein
MKKSHMNIFLTAGAATLLLLSGCASGILSTSRLTATNVSLQENTGTNDNAIITTYVGGIPHSQMISYASGVYLKELFSKLAAANAHDPCSAETQQLQRQILIFAEEQGLLPPGMSADMVFTQLGKRGQSFAPQSIGDGSSVYTAGIGREMFCNFVATGEGAAFPIIILPRFIPFIMAPIPRLFVGWKTALGVTSCGGLLSGTGFYAVGPQQGFALGFWGIGFSIFLPPVMAYGMFGYALFAKATAEYMEYYPPNNPPEITQTDPVDGQQMIPLSTTMLRFSIDDANGDLMSYTVTTNPDIGSGSGGLKPSGTYSIPISGLESLTTYTWHIQVTDGKDIIEKTMTFTTEPVAPVISNPVPADGEREVPMDIQQLQFTLKDYQGDTMEYTVETSPFIGSGTVTDVHNGTYTISVSGLLNFTTYRWFVNVTDGEHWTRKTYRFQTGFPTQFNPFEHGWYYSKKISINHTIIPESLINFPVLVSIVDNNLKEKAQESGDDVLFMNSTGFATRLHYEVEQYDGDIGKLTAWVNITYLSSNEDTTFYMYYGNPNTLSQQDPEKTWDAHYIAVWHFKETSGLNVEDSTTNHFNGTANLDTPVTTGRIGNGRYFDMTKSEIYIGTQPAFGGMTSYCVEAWANPKSISGEHRIFDRSVSGKYNTILLYQDNYQLDSLTNNVDFNSYTNTFSVDIWSHVAGVFTGSGGEGVVYKNGIKGTPIITTQSNPTAGNFTVYIGRACVSSSSAYRWFGTLDELRISNTARSSSWINVSYQNQNDPANFITIGPEEPGS